MVIEPRKVAPGYAKRWSKEALELMGRSFHMWFGIAVVMSLLAWLGDRLVFGGSLIICALMYAISSEIVAISDNHHFEVSDIPNVFVTAAKQTVHEFWTHRVGVVMFVVAVYAIVLALFFFGKTDAGDTPPPPPVDYSSLTVWLFSSASPFSSAAWGAFIVSNLFGYTRWGLPGLRYPLRRTFDISEDAAQLLTAQAADKNEEVRMHFPFMMQIMLMLVMGLLPVLAPFIVCFVPALNYVAFREVFLDDKGNRQPARKTATKLAFQGASS